MRRILNLAAAAVLTGASGAASAQTAELPVPCVAGVCGANIPGFVSSGRATATVTNNLLRVQQQTDRAILNWASFNVGVDGKVIFEQPNSSSIALNRIFDGNPSRIMGAIEANGQIFLINQNGFMFGPTARVRTSGLLVSSLDMAESAVENGLLAPELLRQKLPALEAVAVLDPQGNPVRGDDGQPLHVNITIAAGARISTIGKGGRVIMASRTVDNAGEIDTPDGQVILAAGEKVYLQASTDPSLRGLLVEVDAGGEAFNRMTGSISAARGNVTMVGLAVNQQGRISATSTVSANGSVRLLARDTVRQGGDNLKPTFVATNGGQLELGASSQTTVTPELGDSATAIDEQAQMPSTVELTGRQIFIRGGAQVRAPGGEIRVRAQNTRLEELNETPFDVDPEARVRIESGAVLDASGSDATAQVSRNVVRVELRGNELRDSPLQRDGPLRGKEVFVDVRVGTPLADVTGAIAGIGRAVDERTSAGGTISVKSAGDISVAHGAVFDVSGGTLTYAGGAVQTTQLLTADGRAVDIGQASASGNYVGLINPTSQRHFDRWGVTQQVQGPLIGRYEPGYTEGRSAGTLQFAARALALDGSFLGGVTIGANQRDAARTPQGGWLIVGAPLVAASAPPDYFAPSINLVSRPAPTTVGDDATLPQRPLELSTDFATLGGFTRAELYSNGVVNLPESMMLVMAPGSSLRITARRVEANGGVSSPGGSLRFASVETVGVDNSVLPRAGVSVGTAATLDVRGLWSNELSLLSPIYRDGGEIDLAARALGSELVLGDDVRLLATGGASLSAAGVSTGGRGGSIGLRAAAGDGAIEVGDHVEMSAFGVNNARGGTFALEAPRIEIASGENWSVRQRLDIAASDLGFFSLGDVLFTESGFANFDLTATGPRDGESAETFVVRDGARVDARARTLILDDGIAARQSGGTVDSFAHAQLAPDYLRSATSVALRVDARDFGVAANVGRLSIERDAAIRVEPRGSVSLSSVGGMTIAGRVSAPGGVVTASTTKPPDAVDIGFREGVGIAVTDSARFDLAGITLLRPSDAGLLQGEVLAGGSLNLLAGRGFVEVARGADVDVRGASSAIDIPGAGTASGFQRRLIASAAGSITLRAPESLTFAATLHAQSGVGDTPTAGGTATFQLTRQRGFEPGLIDNYSTAPRTLLVAADPAAITAGQDGIGVVDVGLLRAAGVDALDLEAANRIEFYAGADLNLARSLQIAAPLIGVSGDSVNFAAPYVSFGTVIDTSAIAPTTSLPGLARLNVTGDLIELTGRSAITGVASATFEARGELRMRGFVNAGTSTGELRIAGDLNLRSPLIYPTTGTAFSIFAAGGANDRVTFDGLGSNVDRVPLAVGGSLTVNARSIDQRTRLVAPFGQISLNATDDLTLAAGSTTSVSAAGSLLPFGRTQLGARWVYDMGGTLIDAPDLDARSVNLAARDLDIDAAATVDINGGGDLYAYEWLPGTGGSRDALAAGATPGLYAILPATRDGFAPFDPQEYLGSDLKPGDSIYLAGGDGLAAGVYPLLPARYALLPGAVLVSALPGTTDAAPGVPTRLADGSPVVAGYRTFAGTGIRDPRMTGYLLRPGSYGRQLATYQDARASTFDAASRPVAPDDAARVSLTATHSFDLAGRVLTAANAQGGGASIDIAAPNLVIQGAGAAPVDGVTVNAAVLQSWNAGSLLLGGRRSADGRTVDVSSDSVVFSSGANLSGTEIIAVANDELRLDAGSSLSSADALASLAFADQAPLAFEDDDAGAAVLGVSATRALYVQRESGASTGGRVTAAAGSSISSRGSLLIDGPEAIRAAGIISGAGAAWALGSRDVHFGGESSGGFIIDSSLRNNLAGAGRLRLTAANELSFAENLNVESLREIIIDTPSIIAAGGIDARLDADRLTLLNSGAARASPSGPQLGGSLTLAARDVVLGPGDVRVDSFDLLAIASANEIVGQGAVHLATAGDLTLSAANLGTGSDADVTLSAGGVLRTANAGQALTDTGRLSSELGGRLALDAASIEHGGSIRVSSGRVELAATDGLTLERESLLDVSGVLVSAGGRSVGSAGGALRLASRGTLDANAGAILRASGAGNADAGSLNVVSAGAANFGATLVARSGAGARGGSFSGDMGSIGDFGALNRQLESGGFRERRAVRVAQGDLTLEAGDGIVARDVSLATDAGAIAIAGLIDATSDNQRGRIELSAGGNLTLAGTARLRALGAGALGRGGSLTLASTGGDVDLRAGSQIALGGALEPGRVTVRAAATTDGLRVNALDSTVSGVDFIALQPVLSYDLAATPVAADFNRVRDDVATFMMTAAPALQTRFGNFATPIAIRPGIDLFTDGDLNINTGVSGARFTGRQLDLAGWRFNGEAAAIAFHATGSIDIAGTISDGFQTVLSEAGQRLDLLNENSSSLLFDAGADLRVNANARVRTGTGNLTLRAANDLIFDTGASVYTGGMPGEPTHVLPSAVSFPLPTHGGMLELLAGNDVQGAEVTQAVGAWEIRQGRVFGTPASPPGWGTDFRRFGWNAGTFGGGDLVVRAGHDIRDLSAAAADSASITNGAVNRFGGGVLSFDAEHDITSAYVHATRGINALHAGGELGRSRDAGQESLLGSMFSLQEGSLDLSARRGIALESVFNPTLLRQAQAAPALTTYFLSYADDSRLRTRSATGAIDIDSTLERLGAFIGEQARGDNDHVLLALLPPSATFEATDGDIRLADALTLAPSDLGQLEVFASGDIHSPSSGQFVMSDAPRSSIPSILAQSRQQDFLEVIARNDVSGRHVADNAPALIDAGRDISGVYFLLPKFTRMNAGRDLRNTTLATQNVRATDVTIISAGRDVIYDADAGNKKIEIGGPGRFDVIAARDVDLGFSEGIAAVGRIANPALPTDRGADITIIAGLGEVLDPLQFLTRVVAPAANYRTALQTFVAALGGSSGDSYDASVASFTTLSADLQRAFLLPIFFTELVASGRDANNIPGAGFERGYAAIDALFPGSREPLTTPRYQGDLRLAFSRIYTLADADISLLAPGGLLNVGLANPPTGLAARNPAELGIVAQRAGSVRIFTHSDVLVNQSRVFTLRGGDIAIWSTVGDIDAGRGAKSAISAPPPTVIVDADGKVTLDFAGAVAGSGIRAILTADDIEPGDVDLIAPAGVVDAGDAGIGSAGNLNIAAQHVVGLDNIQVGGSSTGVPAETSNLGAALAGASAVASSASSAAGDATSGVGANQSAAPLADSAFGFLDVFLEGFGTEVCKPDDTECLKRNHQ
ncbi:MAG: filamentous hemagglutinin family protein [Pseudomonadota bacterium]